jgi:hypothetical protein
MKSLGAKSAIRRSRARMEVLFRVIGCETLMQDQTNENAHGKSAAAKAERVYFRGRPAVGVTVVVAANELIEIDDVAF